MKGTTKINTRGWIGKTSRILIFSMLFGVFILQGWFKPGDAQAAVNTLTISNNTAIAISPQNDTAAFVVMQRLQADSDSVSGTDNAVVLNSITVDDIGTATSIAAVRIYISTTSSTSIPTNAVQIGKITNSPGTSQTINLNLGTVANRTVTNGTSKYIYIVYDMAAGQSGKIARSQVTAVGVASSENGVSGQTLNSNSITLNAGVKATVTACTDCHGKPPVDSATRDASTGQFKGSHTKHAGTSNLNLACTVCHTDNGAPGDALPKGTGHRTGYINMANPIYYGSGSYSKASAPTYSFAQSSNPTMGTCNNVYCHSTVQGANGVGAGTDKPQTWGTTGPLSCGACHPDQSSSNGTGSHTKHASNGVGDYNFDCSKCHSGYSSSSVNMATHANRTIDVALPSGSYSGGTTPGDNTPGGGYGNCSNVYCHGNFTGGLNNTPSWGGTAACGTCHGASATSLPGTGGSLNSHTTHVGSSGYLQLQCNACHSDTATGFSLNNLTYHVNNKIDWNLDETISGNRILSASTYSGANSGSKATLGGPYNNCTNIYCHSVVQKSNKGALTVNTADYATVQWGSGSMTCTSCHGNPPTTGNHSTHPSTCSYCHTSNTASTHANGSINFIAGVSYSSSTSVTPGTGAAYGNCTTASCHTNGENIWQGGASSGSSPVWGTAGGCSTCHGNGTYTDYRKAAPLYASVWPSDKPNAHRPHVTAGTINSGETQCLHCHNTTISASTNDAVNTPPHADGSYTVNGGTATFASGEDVSTTATVSLNMSAFAVNTVSTCSNVSCHPNGIGGTKPAIAWNDRNTSYDCTNCHNIALTGTAGYHHSMNSTTYTPNPATESDYPTAVPQGNWSGGTNPASRKCLMCHVKHNLSSDRMNTNGALTQPRAMNLRTDIAVTPTTAAGYSNTDFINSGTYGICVSCHTNQLNKDQARQKAESGAPATPAISGSVYSAGSHSYTVALTTKTGSKTFNASCSKCHDAQNGETASFYTGTNIGTHDSTIINTTSIRRLLSALGITTAPASDSLEENFCYRCHSRSTVEETGNLANPGGGTAKATLGKDYYGSQPMSASTEYIWRDAETTTGNVASYAAGVVTTDATVKNWTANQWIGYNLMIVSGTGAGQARRITAHTTGASATITITPAFTTAPANGSVYRIGSVHDMGLRSGNHTPIEATASGWMDGTAGKERHVECEDCHNPHAAKDGKANASGTVASTTATSLTASGSPNWPTDRWKGYLVNITTSGRGQARYITGNNANTLNISGQWASGSLTAGDAFTIVTRAWEDGGLATGAQTSTSLVDTTRGSTAPAWTAGQWTGYFVRVVSGTGEGQVRKITGNGTNSLTVAAWTTTPAAGSGYVIYKPPTVAGVNAGAQNVVDVSFDTQMSGIGLTPTGVSASAGPNSPSAAVGTNWTTPTNVYSDNAAYAQYSTTTQNDIQITGYGFSVPTNATITGIEVVINGYNNNATATNRQVRVGLTQNGTALAGTRKTAVQLNTTDGNAPTQGGSADLWGTTWTPAQINAATFGVLLSDNDTTAGGTFNIDYVSVKVYYTYLTMRKTTYTAKATAEYQYEICLTCHSTWAYTSEPGPNVPSPYAQSGTVDIYGTTKTQTDVGKDFDPDNYAYHPLFAPGKHQPIRLGSASAAAIGQTIDYNYYWPYVATANNPTVNSTGTIGGTVTATNGSKTVIGSGTTFPPGAGAGWWIWINTVGTNTGLPTHPTTSGIGGGGRGWWPVASRDNTTQLTLAVPFNGTTGGTSSFYLTKGLKSTFVDGWSPESLTTCTDCHNTTDNITGAANVTKARGPHGSANRWLLRFQEVQTVTALNGTVAATTVSNALNFCLNCHSKLVYPDTAIGGTSTTPTNNNYGRINHGANANACWGNTSGNMVQVDCMNCHAGQTATAANASVGTLHGNNIGAVGSGSSPFGFRFQNGAAWNSKYYDYTNGNTSCYNPGTAIGSISTCAHGHDSGTNSASEGTNYSY